MKTDIKKKFGLRIKEYRTKKGLTQAELAELINIEQKHISRIEAGASFTKIEVIEKLAKIFEVEPKDLFEFNHLQEPADLKKDINTMLDKLSKENLSLVYKFIRTFVI